MRIRIIVVTAACALLLVGCGDDGAPTTGNGSQVPAVGATGQAATAPILTVPDLSGLVADYVPTTLQASGFWVGPTRYEPSDKPGNTVIGQDPPPFTNLSQAPYTSKVSVVVSGGGLGGEPKYTFPPLPFGTKTTTRQPALWKFSQGFKPSASSTELRVDISPRGCSGGSGVREPKSEVVYSRSRVTLTITGLVTETTSTCQGLREVQSLIIPLSEPLGDRSVVDGGARTSSQ